MSLRRFVEWVCDGCGLCVTAVEGVSVPDGWRIGPGLKDPDYCPKCAEPAK